MQPIYMVIQLKAQTPERTVANISCLPKHSPNMALLRIEFLVVPIKNKEIQNKKDYLY